MANKSNTVAIGSSEAMLALNKLKKSLETCRTNVAVSMANINVASYNITKSASDIGSAFSILNASSNDTPIFKDCEKARLLVNEIAYAAEGVAEKSNTADLTSLGGAEVVEAHNVTSLADRVLVNYRQTSDNCLQLIILSHRLGVLASFVNKMVKNLHHMKASNPLISDEVISILDATLAGMANGVALLNVAVKSAKLSESTMRKSCIAASVLETYMINLSEKVIHDNFT